MKQKKSSNNNAHRGCVETENLFVATEVICNDEGVFYICPTCGKYHKSDFDALLCCLPD